MAYAAMLAASVSVGALGYAVIWAYTPDEPVVPAPSMPSAVAPPVEIAAQLGPLGVVAPVAVAPRAPASEPVAVSPAIAAAPVELAAPPVASDIPAPRVSAAPTPVPPKDGTPAVAPQAKAEPVAPERSQPPEAVAVPRARPSDVVRQSVETAAPAAPPAAAAIAARPVEGRQARPLPGGIAAPPVEAPAARAPPAALPPAVTPREHAPVGSTTRPTPPVVASPKPSAAPKLAALPPAHEAPRAPAVVDDASRIQVLRGGLRRAGSVRPQHPAVLPVPDTAAHAAPRIAVLRGGAAFRSAHTALLPPVKQPAVTVIRGARSAAPGLAPGLAGLAPPGPLVLRIRD
jgi:hypothetical protein